MTTADESPEIDLQLHIRMLQTRFHIAVWRGSLLSANRTRSVLNAKTAVQAMRQSAEKSEDYSTLLGPSLQ